MKTQLLEILKYEYSEFSQLSEIIDFSKRLIDAIDKQRNHTKNCFVRLLEKYNFDTISKFSEYPEYPQVTLFKGVDNWTLYSVIDYEGGISDVDNEIGELFTDPELYADFDDEIEDLQWELRTKIILINLTDIWLEIGGENSGIVVKILENNSCSSFVLNDLAWDDLSDFLSYNDKSNRVPNVFEVKPNLLTVYSRISQFTYPVYPYYNKWRFFKKETDIIEFVRYGNETGEKKREDNLSDLVVTNHSTLLDTIKYEQNRVLKLQIEGFIEFIPMKQCHIPIYEGAIETKFWSGVNWYANEQNNRININKINSFEERNKVILPFYFKHYLRLFNGRQYNKINMKFYYGKEFLQVKEFYTFEEIEAQFNNKDVFSLIKIFSNTKRNKNWIDIGITSNNQLLSINLLTSKLGIKDDKGIITPSEIDFKKFIQRTKN